MIGQHCHCRRTITRDIIHLVGSLFNQLSTDFKTKRFVVNISNINALCYRYTIMCYTRTAIAFTDHNITPLRTHRSLDCIVQYCRST